MKTSSSSIEKKHMDKHLNILTSLREQTPVKTKDWTILPKSKTIQAGLLYYYLLNNLGCHYQKQNSGMQSIYDMGFH